MLPFKFHVSRFVGECFRQCHSGMDYKDFWTAFNVRFILEFESQLS